MAEVSEAQPGAKAALRTNISGSSIVTDHGHQATTTSAELIIPTTLLTPTTPTPAPSSCLPSTSTSQETPLISSGSQLPVAAVPLPSAHINSVSVVSSMAVDSVAAATSSLSVPDSHAAASLASGSMYNASVITTLASENVHRNSVTTTQAYSTAQLEKTLGYRLDSAVSSASSSVLLGSGTASTDSAAVSLAGSLLSSGDTGLSGTSAMSAGRSVTLSGSHKGKKSGKKSNAAAAAISNPTPSSASTAALSAADALAASVAAESDLTGGASHKLLQAVRSNPLPFPLPVPIYSQTVQAARASGNVLAERATIIRETVKFFLVHKYYWTTEDYDRIAELVVNQFPELRDPGNWPTSTTPCFNKVRLDLSMCARNIRRITKNQEKRKGSPAQTGKEVSASGQAEPPPPPPTPKAPKGGGKSRRKSSMTPSISVPTMVTLASAAQMLPHTAHTAAVHTTLSSQDPKELGNLPYLLTSTSPITTTTAATTTTNSCTVLPPVAHFLGHPSTHSHTTGGIVFPPLLPATHSTPTSQPSPPAPLSPVPAVPKVSHTPVDVGRTTTETGQVGYADNTLSLSGAWRADAQLPDPLPVPPYSEKVMKAKKMGVTKYERPLIIRETVLFFLSLKYWWSSVDYDRISHFVVDYFPDLKDPMLSPNMPPNRRVRTDLSQTARNIRRREVMLRRKDTRSPEQRFTAVGTASLPPHSNQQVSSNFCELLAAASIIESRGALENHAQVSRDSDAIASVIAHAGKDMQQGSVASIEDGKEAGDGGGKETSEVGKYPYSFPGAGPGGVEGGGGNCQLAVIKQEAGEVDPYQQQAWLSAQAMTQALSMQALSSSLSALPPHVSQALSDHLLSSHTPNTLTPAPPAAHQNPGASNGGEGLSTPTPPSQPLSSSYTLSTPGTPSSLSDAALSEASPMDRMSAMAMWRSTCLPDPLPVPPYSLNVLRARDSGNTSSARPRIIRETTQFFLALKMWWTTQDYERIAELVLREFPDLKLVQNIKKDLGTCARNMRRRLPMTKNKQWGSYQSPSQVSSKEGEGVGEGGGVTLGELATMASLREAQDKSRGEVGVVVSVAEDPCHSLLAQSVYDQNAWNLFYQQQFSAPDPAPTLPPPRASKRSLSDATGSKGHEVGEKELAEALKQAVAQSVKQLDMDSGAARRHSVDVGEASKVRDMKQEASGKATPKATSSEVSKSDNYPVMKELISHPALSVRDPKLTTDYTNWTAHIGTVGEGGTGYQHPTPARAHSQPACPLRSDVRISESEEVPMNLTCAPTSEGSKRGKSPKAIKTEAKASKKGGADTFSAREQVWFPHGSPWKKTGQNMFKALPSPLPAPKYSQKLLKAREEGLAYRHRSEIIRETARYFLVLKYWWSSADYSRISELVVNQFPDLKDPITPPGQPCYRRVQRDLSMCARNLRRKNTRQQQLSSGETGSVAGPKKVKGGSKEKKSKKVTGIKVEAAGDLAGLGSRGDVVGSSVVSTTPLVSSPSKSNAALTQAMLQASVDQALASISPLPALPSTTQVTSTPSWTLPQPHVTNATILSHLVSPVTTTTPLSLAHTTITTTLPATHTTATYPSAYPTVQPPAYSTVHTTTPSSAHTVSVVVSAPGAVTGKDGRADRPLWPVVVPANGLSESVGNSKAAAKKKSGAASKLGQASAKQGQVAPKSGHVTAKSVASIQPKVEKRVAAAVPSIHPPQGQEEGGGHTLPQAGSGGRGRGPSGGVAHVTGSSKRSKDSARHLTSRSGEGRSQSNTTAIITPTLSEAHASAAATGSEGGSVADKVYINPEHGSELQRQLTQLWQEGKFFDASLEVDNYRLPAHKLVLLAASPYLQSTFRHANPTSHLEVNLPRDTGVEAARSFLKYVYQGVLHVTPETVQALRRIAAMLQIDQLLVYCDDFLLQLSASSATGSSAVAVPHRRASVPHASSQVRRVSVNLREPTQPHPLTTEPSPAQPLPGSATPVAAGTAHYRLSPEQHQRPSQSSSARKRRATSLASPLDGQQRYVMGEGEGREGVEAFSACAEGDKQKGFEGSNGQQRQQEGDPVPAKCFRSSDLSGVESVSSKAYLDSQAYQSLADGWQHPVEDSRPQSVLAQHLSAEKIHGRAPTSSVIHRGPNLLAASAVQGELTSSSNMTTSTTTSTTGSSSSDTTFTTTNGDEGGSVVQYLADAASFAAGVQGEGGEESVLVRLLPEGQVQMEIGEGGLQFQPAHTMHLPPTIQLSRDQALHLTRDGAIHLGEGGVVHHLTREEALQLAGQAAQQGIPLSEEALSEQVAGDALCVQQQQQQQQLSQEQQLVTLGHNAVVGDMAVQLVEQSIALCGGDGQGAEEEEQGVERGEELGEGQVVCDQERWEGEEVVVQGGEGMMVEEVIVQSGDLLQDVDVAACETVECSLLPQTYCSSPEDCAPCPTPGEEDQVGGQALPGEAAERVEESGEQALQTLASQWVRQQYAHAPLDADTARQFVAALQERMYGQPSTTSASLQPPPAYPETLYVQPCGDGETVYVSQTMEGEELVVETSEVTDTAPQPAGLNNDDDGDSHASLLPQTYCSSSPRSQSPSVST